MTDLSKMLTQLHQSDAGETSDFLTAPPGITPVEVMVGVKAFFSEHPKSIGVRLIADFAPRVGDVRTGPWQAPTERALEQVQSEARGRFDPGTIEWVTVTPNSLQQVYSRVLANPTAFGSVQAVVESLPGTPNFKPRQYQCPRCLNVISVILLDGMSAPTCNNGHAPIEMR